MSDSGVIAKDESSLGKQVIKLTKVGLHFVITSKDLGGATSALVTNSQIASWVSNANDVFRTAGVKFEVKDIVTEEDPDLDNDYVLPSSYDPNDHTDVTKFPFDGDPALKAAADDSAIEHYVNRAVYAENHTPGIGVLNEHFVFLRRGNPLSWNGTKWAPGRLWGGFAGLAMNHVSMQNLVDARRTLLAHELGHYFGLPHTFWENPLPSAEDPEVLLGDSESSDKYLKAAEAVIKAGVLGTGAVLNEGEPKFSEQGALNIFDNDRRAKVVNDTPPDINPDWFWKPVFGKDAPLDEAVALQAVITVDFAGKKRDYTLAPDRTNVMGYYMGSGELGRKLSKEQRKVVRSNLGKRFRKIVVDLSDLLVRTDVPPADPVELDISIFEVDEFRTVVAAKVGTSRLDRVLRASTARGGKVTVSKAALQRVQRGARMPRPTPAQIPRPCGSGIRAGT